MEMVRQYSSKITYYFSGADQEILDDRTLALSCDEDTWLYKIEDRNYNGQFQPFERDSHLQNRQNQSTSGTVDTRTFTRRKHCSLRPSLESVVESPLSNRSSLGVLSASKLLNDTLQIQFTPTPISENQEKTSLSFIASDKKPVVPRIFKLDSPFLNSQSPSWEGTNKHFRNHTFGRPRIDSESSDSSIPHSLENYSPFEKNGVMTDSLTNFLEKQEVYHQPVTTFQDEDGMTNSLVSLPEHCDHYNAIGENEQLTASMIDFLAPVNCKPPSGFEDTEMTYSLVNVEKEVMPGFDLSKSVTDYLENVKTNKQNSVSQSTALFETENIPPDSIDIKVGLNSLPCEKVKSSGDGRMEESKKLNSTFDLNTKAPIYFNPSIDRDEITNVSFTNTVNITLTQKENTEIENSTSITKGLDLNFERCRDKDMDIKKYNEKILKTKALNNRDLNVTRDMDIEETVDLNLTKTLIKSSQHSTSSLNTISNTTFTRDDLNETTSSSKQLPSRNSTFNTTFTKLHTVTPSHNSTFTKQQSLGNRALNSTFAKSSEGLNGGMEEDQASSASDSSFSSGSTKSSTASKQQKNCLVQQQTSTPTGVQETTSNLASLDLELSPIRRLSLKNNESRSANCSPVRSQYPHEAKHPISGLRQPIVETRRQQLQASSLSNIARPKVSGLRMPQPVSVFKAPQSTRVCPTTAGPAPVTGIPRPQKSRLPMPSFRRSGIPGPKYNGLH